MPKERLKKKSRTHEQVRADGRFYICSFFGMYTFIIRIQFFFQINVIDKRSMYIISYIKFLLYVMGK